MQTLERRVRQVVADRLGVDQRDLAPAVSLPDDLGVDSLDFRDLALALEAEMNVPLDDGVLGSVRCYRELVAAVVESVWRAEDRASPAVAPPVVLRARIAPGRRPGQADVVRAGRLDPYLAEVIAADALNAGPGSRLDLGLAAAAGDTEARRVAELFAWLDQRGIAVRVDRCQAQDVAQ